MSNKLNLFSQFSSVKEAMAWSKSLMNLMKPFIYRNGACIVIDIDDTLLNAKTLRGNQYVIEVAKYAYDNNIPIHIITARVDVNNNRLLTIQHLANIGLKLRNIPMQRGRTIAYYDSLSMRSLRDFQHNHTNFSGYKYRARCNLPQPVLLNIGDQWDDLIRRPPYSQTKREEIVSNQMVNLSQKNVYVAQLPDCAWFSIKVPAG